MKVAAVIKASCISNHFPDRYKIQIGGKSPLESLVDRLSCSSLISQVVLATTYHDEELTAQAKHLGIDYFQGRYEDSLGRILGASEKTKADIIVKVPGNYPLVDPWEMEKLLRHFMSGDYLYAFNEHLQGVIYGLGVEIVSFDFLKQANEQIIDSAKRRFGTNLFKDILNSENILRRNTDNNRPNYRVTLAVPNDTVIVDQIIRECPQLDNKGIAQYLDQNPVVVSYAEQNIDGPKEVGTDKIFLFPQKIETLSRANEKIDTSFPISVELSLTNRCNLACRWCSDNDLRRRAMEDLDFALIEKLLHDLSLHGTKGVVIEGGGEPTLYQRFDDVIACAQALDLGVGLITNGIKTPYLEHLDKFEWIRISLDSANPEQFIDGKGKDCFNQVIQTIEQIAQQRNPKITTVGIAYVLTNHNENGLEDLVLNLRRLNINYIQIRPVIDHPELFPKNLDLSYLKKYSSANFTVNIHNLKENTILGNSNLPCRSHSLSSVIAANGDVFLCGRLNKYDWMKPIGNLYDHSFQEIWAGEERKRQTKLVANRQFCRKWCPECRLTKYNVLFSNVLKSKTKNFI